MKKCFLLFLFSAATLVNANPLRVTNVLPLDVSIIDPTVYNPLPRTPILVPTVSIDGYTLYFDTPCDGCTLRVVSGDEVVEYTTVIPAGATSLTLPSTLSGNYELQIIRGNFCFYGDISL